MSGAPLPFVRLMVVELEVFASANTPRGSVEGFNLEALAADWNASSGEQLARIYATLEHPEVGWLEQDFIVTFWERNPDQEITERQRELARARQQRKRDRAKTVGTYPPSRVTPRDSVTSRTRSDQIKQQEGLGEKGSGGDASTLHSNSGESEDKQVWLAFEGKRIVAERCALLPTRAWTEIMRWRKELADDVPALAQMIADADLMGLTGGKFADRMRDEIIRYRYQANGPALPLRPTALKRGGEHG